MTRLLFVVFVVLCSACGPTSDRAEPSQSRAPEIRRIVTAPGVSLEVIDWGGRGLPLVFLAGLGNTAHVFDDFAPAFTDQFRVFGITRRGFGASAAAPPANDISTLVGDIVAVLDTLQLDSVVLVGHSIAGEEMTFFGEKYGNRCAGLVYLDAAYDRVALGPIFQAHPLPQPPEMQPADSASFEALRAFATRMVGVQLPESEIRATRRFGNDGRYVGDVTPDSLVGRVLAAVRTPHYEAVQCPSLAFYGVADSVAQILPFYSSLGSAGRAGADAAFTAWAKYGADNRAQFARLPQNRAVEMPRANHYLFLQHPTDVSDAMRAFLDSLR